MASASKLSRSILLLVVLVAGLGEPAYAASGLQRYVIDVRLPREVTVVSLDMEMQVLADGSWSKLSRVTACMVPKKCIDSRISDDLILPALPGPRTKNGARYVLYFSDLPKAKYRFILTGYGPYANGPEPTLYRTKTWLLGED